MTRKFSKSKLFNSINKNNKHLLFISVITFSIAVMIVSVLFFIRANNVTFFRSNSLDLNAGDISIYIENYLGKPISLDEKQLDFLQTLQKEDCDINIDYYRLFEININGEMHKFLFRFQDDADLDRNCIISTLASEKLKIMTGDTIHIDFLNTDLNISKIEKPTMSVPEASFYGYIILSSKYIVNFAQIFGLKDNNISTITDYLNTRIVINDNANDFDALYEKVVMNFSPVEKSKENGTTVKIMTIDEIESDYYLVFEVVENVLLLLTILSFIISAIGFLVLLYLKALKQQKLYATLRVYGMSRKDSLIFALYDTLTIAAISNLLGIFAGYLLFSQISIKLTGIPPQYHLLHKDFLNVVVKTFILSTMVMVFCNLWMYSHVYNMDIMDVLQKRAKQKKNRTMLLTWFMGGMIMYSLTVAALLQKLIAVLYLFILLLLIMLLYKLFTFCICILKKFPVKMTGINSLGYNLTVNRKKFSSLAGTSIVTGLLLVFIIYNINYGFEDYLEKIWISKQGFNACVTIDSALEKEFKAKLDEHSFQHFRIYTKLVNFKNTGSPYYFGVLRDEKHIAKRLTVKQGEFHANPYFMHHTNVALKSNYIFNSNLQLRLTQELPKADLSPVSYTVLANYIDIQSQIDDTYQVNFLLMIEKKDLNRLAEIAKASKGSVITSETIVKLLKDGFADYIVLVYITCLLLSMVIVIVMFTLTYSLALIRSIEFSIYRVFGASQKNISNIIILENIIIAVISALQASGLTLSILNLFSYLFTGSVDYFIPIWIMVSIIFGIAFAVWLISLMVIKTFQFGRVVDVLRSD